ncbi:MAG: hypothetical protein M3Z20_00510 [Chloroflexota bacterium]|nr:hypothetical protein [Chloroflexota bacterium]
MKVTREAKSTSRSDLDTVDEPDLRQIQPRPIRWDDVDSAHIAISYDRTSDTLLIHLFGRRQPSVSMPIEGHLYALVDPESERIVGIHIERFLAQAVKEHPAEIAILDHAELRGITPIEVRGLQRETLGSWQPLPGSASAVRVLEASRDKKQAVTRLLDAEKARWGLLDTTAG